MQILEALQENARRTNADIARKLDRAPSAILDRIRKLERRGVITGYEPRIDPHKVGRGLLAFVFVQAIEDADEEPTSKRLAEIPEVLELHHVAGEDCYLAKVRTSDTDSLGELLQRRFVSIPTVTTTRTTIVLRSLRDRGLFPLPCPSDSEQASD